MKEEKWQVVLSGHNGIALKYIYYTLIKRAK